MIKAVIFDMDGVMINSEPLWEKTEKIMMARKGLDYTPVYREEIVGLGQKDSAKLLKSTFSLTEDIEEIIKERISILLDIYNNELSLVNDLIKLLELISKNSYRVALASSSPLRVVKFVLNKFNLNKYFNPVVSGDMVKLGKPNPDIYLYTAERLGVTPKQCLVIEDSINGVNAAKNAGMYCVAVPDKRLDQKGFENADIVLDNLGLIKLSLIEKLN